MTFITLRLSRPTTVAFEQKTGFFLLILVAENRKMVCCFILILAVKRGGITETKITCFWIFWGKWGMGIFTRNDFVWPYWTEKKS